MARRTATSIKSDASAELADILSMAVELNRNGAMSRNVRIHCYVLDQAIDFASQLMLLNKLDLLLGRAIERAHWGSLVTCQAGIGNGQARFCIRFAIPARDEHANPSGIDWIDEVWSWSPSSGTTPSR